MEKKLNIFECFPLKSIYGCHINFISMGQLLNNNLLHKRFKRIRKSPKFQMKKRLVMCDQDYGVRLFLIKILKRFNQVEC